MRWHSEANRVTECHIKIRNQNDFQVPKAQPSYSRVLPEYQFLAADFEKKKMVLDSNF